MIRRLMLSFFLGLAIAAGVALPAAQACGRQTSCCCPHQQTTPACAIRCAGDDTGMARQDASPFRITRLPLGRPLWSLAAGPRRYAPPVAPFHARHPQDSTYACTPPKRYLLSCDLRL